MQYEYQCKCGKKHALSIGEELKCDCHRDYKLIRHMNKAMLQSNTFTTSIELKPIRPSTD